MKIIFIDIDGVFNSVKFYTDRHKNFVDADIDKNEFDPECVKIFNRIIEVTNADIVVSSMWRRNNLQYLKDLFAIVGLNGNVIGETPILKCDITIPRGVEIESYYREHYNWWFGEFAKGDESDLESFVIIDDDGDMLWYQRNNFIKINPLIGLTNADADRAIEILNTPLEH